MHLRDCSYLDMEEKYTMRGYKQITIGIMSKNASFFGVGSKPIYDYIKPVLDRHYISHIELTDHSLPRHIIEDIKEFYNVR